MVTALIFRGLLIFYFCLFLYRFIFLEKESERIRINKRREDDYRRLILPKNKSYNIFLVTYTHTYTYTHTHIKMALKRINKVSSPFFGILVLEPWMRSSFCLAATNTNYACFSLFCCRLGITRLGKGSTSELLSRTRLRRLYVVWCQQKCFLLK